MDYDWHLNFLPEGLQLDNEFTDIQILECPA